MAIARMQEPRQLYGLGSLVKKVTKGIKGAVKGVAKTVKKNPMLALAALNFAPMLVKGGASTFFGGKNAMFGLPSLFGGSALPPSQGLGKTTGLFGNVKKVLGSTAGQVGVGAALSALAASGMDQEEIAEIENDPEKLRIYLKDYYSKTNPDASGAEIEEFVRINSAVGGRVGLMGGAMPTGVMRANKAGTIERDYRETGGFVPVGIKEKADDVPAMLSKNEFVMTADAVRGMGDGNIEKGAQRLYDQMKQAEKRVV